MESELIHSPLFTCRIVEVVKTKKKRRRREVDLAGRVVSLLSLMEAHGSVVWWQAVIATIFLLPCAEAQISIFPSPCLFLFVLPPLLFLSVLMMVVLLPSSSSSEESPWATVDSSTTISFFCCRQWLKAILGTATSKVGGGALFFCFFLCNLLPCPSIFSFP